MFNVTGSPLAHIATTAAAQIERVPISYVRRADFSHVYALTWQLLNFSTMSKILVSTLLWANFKNFPLVYHLRLLNAIRFVIRTMRPPKDPTPDQLFQPIITSSTVPLTEFDAMGHKSNSTYFSDHDIARAHLVCTLFSKGIEKVRGGTTPLVNGKPPSLRLALGAVSCSFKKELGLYERYDMWTRVLSWDQKWVYVVTHFVKKNAKIEPDECTLYSQQNSANKSLNSSPRGSISDGMPLSRRGSLSRASNSSASSSGTKSAICASALSKIVFKNGRISIAPEVMLHAAGLLPPRPKEPEAVQKQHLAAIQIKDAIADGVPTKEAVNVLEQIDGSDEEGLLGRGYGVGVDEKKLQEWEWERIEIERKRGLKIAHHLEKQSALEDEFYPSEALGKHTDGNGIGGVVFTLAQLGKLSRLQFL